MDELNDEEAMAGDEDINYEFSTYHARNNHNEVQNNTYQKSKVKVLSESLFECLETVQYLTLDSRLVQRQFHQSEY